ncbi:Protein of unknown function (DUF581 [Striga hermonthica]|uniref:FLZ-type domain-containing protein n=1 Tax=Striga hermonthica TaxID=68872 RepID=A0A9N7MNP3_STRHE|nr:Protein of unknown function (DUF581 [Striga hermonthica]
MRSKKRGSIHPSSSCTRSDDEGLRLILRQRISNNILVNKPVLLHDQTSKPACDQLNYCYLKSCHLCRKPLSMNKEIYMYSDLGCCSVECRERQIYLDETEEIEMSAQMILSTLRQRSRPDGGGGRCETRRILEDLRMRRGAFTEQESPVIFL